MITSRKPRLRVGAAVRATGAIAVLLVLPASAQAAWTNFPIGAGTFLSGPVANSSGLWFTAALDSNGCDGCTSRRSVVHIANDGTLSTRPIPRDARPLSAPDGSVWLIPYDDRPFGSLLHVAGSGESEKVSLGRTATQAVIDSAGHVWTQMGHTVVADATGRTQRRIRIELRKGERPGLLAASDGSVWSVTTRYIERMTTAGRAFRDRAHGGTIIAATSGGAMWGGRGFDRGGYRRPVRISASGRVHVFPATPQRFQWIVAAADGAAWLQPALKGGSASERIMRLAPGGALRRFSLGLADLAPGPDGAMWAAAGTYDDRTDTTTPTFFRLAPDGSIATLDGGCLPQSPVAAPDGRVWEAGSYVDHEGNEIIAACVYAP
jgi:hypothetical protein